MSKELKSCPFCGESVAVVKSNGIGDYYIQCGSGDEEEPGCGVRMPQGRCEFQGHAIAVWNTRAVEDDLKIALEAVKLLVPFIDYYQDVLVNETVLAALALAESKQ